MKLVNWLSTNGGNFMKNKKLKRVRTIIWDCDNTIWMHRKDEINIIARHFKISDLKELEVQYFEMLRQYDEVFAEKKVTFEEFANLIKEHLPIIKKYGYEPEEFLQEWLTIETSFLNEDALETIKYLHYMGFENIILTDLLWDKQIRLLEKYGVLPYITHVYACDGEYSKRNPKTKSRIVKNGEEEEFLMVGDSLKNDIAFANMAKIQSVWFNPNFMKNDTQFKPTYEINSMLELCKMLA